MVQNTNANLAISKERGSLLCGALFDVKSMKEPGSKNSNISNGKTCLFLLATLSTSSIHRNINISICFY